MRYLCTFILAFAVTFSILAQSFQVVHVNGAIFNITQNKDIALGDNLSETDQLDFKVNDATCFLLNLPKGRYLLKAGQGQEGMVSDVLTQVPKRSSISTRSGGDSTIIDLSNYFGRDHYLFFNTEEKLFLHTFFFPLDESKSVVARYQKGDTKVTIPLKNEGQLLLIDPSTLYGHPDSLNKSVLSETTSIYMCNHKTKEFALLTSFYPVIVTNEQLTAEINVIIKAVGKTNKTELFAEITTYLTEVYGMHNERILKKWLAANVDLQFD